MILLFLFCAPKTQLKSHQRIIKIQNCIMYCILKNYNREFYFPFETEPKVGGE